jgi:uncharacterized protein (TIGR02145 family)
MSKAILRTSPFAAAVAHSLLLASSGQGQPADSLVPGETVPVCGEGCFTDPRDGMTYPLITVGGHRWFARNLAHDSPGSTCAGTDSAACDKDGRFYPWGEATVSCPQGWKLPTDSDWTSLASRLGGDDSAGVRLKTRVGWNSGGNGSDAVGFGAHPSGIVYSYGIFDGQGGHAFFWTSTPGRKGRSWYRGLDASYRDLNRSDMDTLNRLSVRCVEDAESSLSVSKPKAEPGTLAMGASAAARPGTP